MSIKLLTTAIALTVAAAVTPVFGQVTTEEKSKVSKDAPGKAPSMPKMSSGSGKGTGGATDAVTTAEKSKEGKEVSVPSAKVGEKGKAGAVTTAEKSKEVTDPPGKTPSMPKMSSGSGKGTGGQPDPVSQAEKSKVVK